MLRWLLGALLAGVVLFVWGFVYYTVLPVNKMVMKKAPDEKAMLDVLKAGLGEDGVYALPYPQDKPGAAGDVGPMAQVFFRAGAERGTMAAKDFVLGYLHLFASALLVGALLLMCRDSLPHFGHRWIFVVVAGAFASVFVQLAGPVWFRQPWSYHLATAGLYQVAGWLLAALPLAGLIRKS